MKCDRCKNDVMDFEACLLEDGTVICHNCCREIEKEQQAEITRPKRNP